MIFCAGDVEFEQARQISSRCISRGDPVRDDVCNNLLDVRKARLLWSSSVSSVRGSALSGGPGLPRMRTAVSSKSSRWSNFMSLHLFWFI